MSEGFALDRDEGTTFAYLGGLATYKISVEETGSWGLAVETSPAGFASPLHIHHGEDSGFFILRGRMRVRCGDATSKPERRRSCPPRDVPDAFKVVGDEPATWVNIEGPSGDFRRYVEAIGLRLDRRAWPPPVPSSTPPSAPSPPPRTAS